MALGSHTGPLGNVGKLLYRSPNTEFLVIHKKKSISSLLGFPCNVGQALGLSTALHNVVPKIEQQTFASSKISEPKVLEKQEAGEERFFLLLVLQIFGRSDMGSTSL